MQKSNMARIDSRVFKSITCASKPALKGQEESTLEKDVVLIQEDEKNSGRWNIEIVFQV